MDDVIVINFLEAYQRKELKVGHRITYADACRESGLPYATFLDYLHGRSRTVSLNNILKLMVWLEVEDFNEMFERRSDEQPKR